MTIQLLLRDDFEDFVHLIRALAEFEKLDPPDEAAIERLRRDAFADHPRFEAFIARGTSGEALGYAIIFETYSSFLAKPTLYLEDLFVLPEHRRQGVGRALMRHLIQLARQRDCGRMEWQVLDWNDNALRFYRSLQAKHMTEWYVYRLTASEFDHAIGQIQP